MTNQLTVAVCPAIIPLMTDAQKPPWRYGDEETDELLRMLAQGRDTEQAISRLAVMGERAVEPVLEALKYLRPATGVHPRDFDENLLAILHRMGEPAVLPLIAALSDENSGLRWSAAWTLGYLRDQRAVEPLITALEDENEWVRWAAANGLGQLGDQRAVETLITRLCDSSTSVRFKAVEALGLLGDERAVEPLERLIADPYLDRMKAPGVRNVAV